MVFIFYFFIYYYYYYFIVMGIGYPYRLDTQLFYTDILRKTHELSTTPMLLLILPNLMALECNYVP